MLKRLKYLAMMFGGLVCIAASAAAQSVAEIAAFEKTVEAELAETGTPGAAVIVVQGGRPAYVKTFGLANAETRTPFTPDTVYRISLMSNVLSATVLLCLAEEGRVNLDRPIGRYISGLQPKLARVTGRQLLTQSAGMKEEHLLPGLFDDAALGKNVRGWGDEWFMAEPNTVFSHSHPGYAVVGMLIESVARKPYADVMAEKLFVPLGMGRTTARVLEAVTHSLAQGHRIDNGKATVFRPFNNGTGGWPSEAIFSTSTDLSRFLQAVVDGGMLDGRQVIPAAVVAKLVAPQTPDPKVVKGPLRWGLGLLSEYVGTNHVMRGPSSWAGFAQSIRLAPDQKSGIVLIANGRDFPKAARMITAATQPTTVPPAPAPGGPIAMTQSEIARYLGTYTNERTLTLMTKDGRLFVRDESRYPLTSVTSGKDFAVEKIGDNRFRVPEASSGFSFIMDKGEIQYLFFGGRALPRVKVDARGSSSSTRQKTR